MKKQEIKNLLNQLKLKADCFTGEVNPNIKIEKENGIPKIKLYHKICFACKEEGKFSLYPLSRILELNKNRVLPFHNCKERDCNIEACVVSLRIDLHPNTRFTKINKLEIIYI